MTRAAAALLVVAMLAGGASVEARGPRGARGFGLSGHPRHGHPINAWLGSRRMRLR